MFSFIFSFKIHFFFQSLESELSKLGGVLTADMAKAKELLNSSHEDIPVQIHQDLASTYLELDQIFIAVSQMCAERNDSLIQEMEVGKVCVKMADNIKLIKATVYMNLCLLCDFSLTWKQHTNSISGILMS